MAADKFNSLTGYSVGLPSIDVIAANGNVVTNHNYPQGNVTSNSVYANNYYFSNGQPFTSDPAGSNTEVQFNNNGEFGASPNLVFDTTTVTLISENFTVTGNSLLGDAQNVSILGGVNGYVLQTDGAGGLSWTAQTGGGGGGNGTPGGSNMQVQFNSAGTFAGDAGFIYDVDNDLLSAIHIAGEGGNLSNLTYSNITGIGNISTVDLTGANNTVLYGNGVFADISAGASANFANYAGNVTVAAQPNITSVGTLTGLQVNGDLSVTANIGVSNLAVTEDTTFSGPVNFTTLGNVTVSSNINAITSPNINLPVANLHIDGGLNGYVLATDGAGNLSWTIQSGGGGGGTPGGANTQMQFNNQGAFGGSANFVYDSALNRATMAGEFVANNLTVGSGAYSFRTTKVKNGVTTTTSAVEICATEAASVSAVDYTIVATDPANSSRQTVKITTAVYGTTVNYSEYATISVGSLLADFEVTYVPGDAFRNAQVVLYATPATTNETTYKILLEEYSS